MGAFGAVIGGIAGGVAGAVSSYALTKKNAAAYKSAAKEIRSAANKYSGQSAYNAMQNKGNETGNIVNQRSLQAAAALQPNNNSNKMANVADLSSANQFENGYNLGTQNEKTNLNSRYNAQTAKAQQALKQAGIDYQAGTAATQAAFNAAGGLAGLYKDLKPSDKSTTSDERAKRPAEYNNKEGLPKADAADALRQIESIEYKYKPETGLDQDSHVGVTAQSLEGTAFDDVVSENSKGIKQLDKQKLQESVMAGIAALQKEIDELKAKEAKEGK